MKSLYFAIICLIFITGCSSSGMVKSENNSLIEPESVEAKLPETQNSKTPNEPASEEISKKELPANATLEVPFISQAPLGNWDNLHNEACEEASAISGVEYFLERSISREEMDKQILDMVNWQEENFGGHFDLPAEKVKEMVEKYYGNKYKVDISYDMEIDAIKRKIADGVPVIIPVSGRTIGNPYFKQPGPVYHMLVIKGYDDSKGEFITNDVGTNKLGENFRYKYDTLFDSIHDMPKWEQTKSTLDKNPKLIFQGRKVMLTISK